MLSIIQTILAEFKCYRRRQGGTWYYIYFPDSAGGPEGTQSWWTQQLPEGGDFEIEKKEEY
jgi:hypothetical protein